jgi:hypothetical protein
MQDWIRKGWIEDMNQKHDTIRSMLTHLVEDATPPKGIDLWPAIQGRLIASKSFSQTKEPNMKNDVYNHEEGRKAGMENAGVSQPSIAKNVKINNSHNKPMRPITASLIILLILAAIFFISPQGQAWAQTVLRFFKHAGNEQILPTPMPVQMVAVTPGVLQPTLTPTAIQNPAFFETCGDFHNQHCTLEQIQGMVDFPVKAIAIIPEGMTFVGATGGVDGITLAYKRDEPMTMLLLDQEPVSKGESPLSVADSADIETVSIGETQGEYVRGAWSNFAGDVVARWDANEDIQSLRWESEGMLYTIEVMGSTEFPSGSLDKESMALLAAGLTDEIETLPVTQPTPEIQKSLAEIEQQASFEIVEPDDLPPDYRFDGVDFLPGKKMVCLFYRHPADDTEPSLSIAESVESPLPDLDELFPTLPKFGQYLKKESVTVGGAVDGKGIYARGNMDATQVCGNRFQSKVLLVQTKGLNISIYTQDSGMGAAHNWLTRQEMVQLAESITGIKTIAEGQLDPEFITSFADAEKLAGFHLKQPTQLPEGKIFDHVRIEIERNKHTAVISYSDSNNVFEISQTAGGDDTLETISKDHPEAYDPVTVHNQAALISQGFWDNNGWKEIEAGGDGGVTLAWFEDGIRYMISGFNEYPRHVWLAIAESLK